MEGPTGASPFEFAHQVQVGVARTRASDSDDHLLWTWDGIGHLHQNRIGLPLHESQRSHQIYLSFWPAEPGFLPN